ncbi:MAG TPA: ATP-binding protein [Candidatus Dormibacteraeota bacterium]|jgi:signal transduction histidine kinase|nr:ATP-binding protein [Candidatus Dormibacteraeota bacterium]
MKSLFLKIFVSFWVALALFVVLAILVTLAMRPQRNSSWEALRTSVINEAVSEYEQGGEQQVRQYLETLQEQQHVRAYIFDEKGNEISHRAAPDWAERVAKGGPRNPHDGFIIPVPPVLRESRSSSDGQHRYTLVLGLPPGPRVFFGPRGLPFPGLIILVLSSGLVCYFLAWYVTKPVARLRAATQQLAAGDLTARAGDPKSKRRDEIAGLVRDFDTMAGRLETLVKAQSRLLNDISHELRSPLARLNVALGLARQRSGEERAAMLERIELEAGRLNELIGRLLSLARLEDGEQRPPSTPVLLDEVVLNVAEDAEFEAQARHCHVHSEIPAGSWGVRGDASLLHSAVENVVRNAIRYTREGTTVEIHLEKTKSASGEEAVIRVTDCGDGVPADALEKLFQPFYRLDDARGRQTGGVGLGLAITERAVRFHGGRVSATNRAEGGLMVEIRLPLMPASLTPVVSGQWPVASPVSLGTDH